VVAASGDTVWEDDINRQFIVLGRLKTDVTMTCPGGDEFLAQRAAKERP
jgi:hypothetical protein